MISGPLASKRQTSSPLGATAGAAADNTWWLNDGNIAASDVFAAYQPKGAASYAASLSNLNDPGINDAVAGVAPSWSSGNGWEPNGSTQYLIAGAINPTATTSIIVRMSGVTARSQGFGGITFPYYHVFPRFTDNKSYWRYGSFDANSAYTGTGGVFAMTPTGAYIDGVLKTSITASAPAAQLIYLMAINNGGAAQYFMNTPWQAVAIYKINIAPYISELTTLIQAL